MTEKEEVTQDIETPEVENPTVEETVVETPAAEVVEETVVETPVAETVEEVVVETADPEVAEDDVLADEEEPDTAALRKVVVSEEEEDEDLWGDDEGYSKEERSRLEKMYESTLKSVEENEIVTGTVVSIGDKEVILNIGFKSEGVVPTSEFRDLPDLKPGDEVEVFLETVEDAMGQLVLSRKRAKHMRTWALILQAENGDVILQGTIKRRTKGGFVVDIDGIEAFLPGSQIDVKPVRDFDAYVGKTMDFKVVKINHPFENVVISHKVLIEKDLEKQRQEILKNLEKGQVLEGTVKNMTNFGVFIDLGGVDGLLHITDISWGRINHPEEILELDQKINVVVLDFDEEKKRISLGLKQLQAHPWDSLPETIVEGTEVTGKVVTVAEYGIFIEIMPGVEGLVHLSEMSWSAHLKDPSELFKINDSVQAVVLSIDREDRKMSLGIKQTQNDPWALAAAKFSKGSTHTGTVRGMTNYGLFVELEEGIDGLVHISDLSWTKKFNHPNEFTSVGEKLEIVVLDIDVENRRLSLGHKQLTEDVWETFESIFVIDSLHSGTILRRDDKGAIAELEYGIEGFVPNRHLETPDGADEIKVGDKVELKVIEFNKDAKNLVLSYALTWKEMVEEDKKSARTAAGTGGAKGKKKKSSGSGSGSSAGGSSRSPKAETTLLGEIDALQALKQQMEAAEKDEASAEKKEKKKTTKKTKKEETVEETPVAEVITEDTEDAKTEEE